MKNLEKFYSTDIGINAKFLYEVVSKYNDKIFVDLGVRTGVSSEIMLIDSEKNKTTIGPDERSEEDELLERISVIAKY